MPDQEDFGDVDDGLADRIREAALERAAEAALVRPTDPGRASRTPAELTWATILAGYLDTARRQDQVTAAYPRGATGNETVTAFRIRMTLLLLLLASPVSAQGAVGHPDVVTPALENGPARTICVAGQPLSQFMGPLTPDVLEQLLVHEGVHRRQLASDCDDQLAVILADPYRHADAEAEAGCAQFNAAVADQVHRTFELGNLRGWLYARFPEMSRDTLNLLIARRCESWKAS